MSSVAPRKALGAALAVALTLALCPSAGAFSKAIWGPVIQAGVSQFPLYKRLGVSIFQDDLDWSAVAPTRPARATDPRDPAYRWPAELGQAIAQARQFHMQVMLQIMFAPPWASGHSLRAWAPRRPADFAAFATAAARHYPTVHLWMIWGEPTRAGNWAPITSALPGIARLTAAQKVAPHIYSRILDAAYGALKHVNGRNLVIGGDTYTTGLLDPRQWISNLRLPSGKPPRMDMYGHNPFSYSSPTFSSSPSLFDEIQFSDLPTLAGWVDKYVHKGLPLFLSEWTVPTAPDEEFNFYVDPPVAATWVSTALRLARRWQRHRIYALGWIHVYDDPPYSYGGLLTSDGRPKPTFGAFQHG